MYFKRLKTLGLLGVVMTMTLPLAKATHLMGGEITYTCIGPNQYRIRVKLYRDCGGIELEDPITLNLLICSV